MNSTETAFLVAVVAVLAVAAAVPLVTASTGDSSSDTSPDIDHTYAIDPPDVSEGSGTAVVDGATYDSVTAALEHADSGDTIVLEGVFEESVRITKDDVTLVAGEAGAVIDGQERGHVVNVTGTNVSLEGLWIRNSGYDTGNEDAGVFVDGHGATLNGLYVSDILWGVWVDGVDDVLVDDSYIEGREHLTPMVERGNGIHLWETVDTVVRDTTIQSVRDGIYYSWATDVVTENTTIANSRYGVHFMYSDNNRMVNNTAVDNDVGYALMVSKDLEITGNKALHNSGSSGHGILVKDVDNSEIRDNVVVDNQNGLYVYNSNGNDVVDNLIVENDAGMVSTAGSERQYVVGNSFIDNELPAMMTTQSVHAWNGTEAGNYWSSANPVDVSGDGVSDVRYRPTGMVEHLTTEYPQVEVFAQSPAFDAVRMAESSFPVIESPGIVDHRPLAEPNHENWQQYVDDSSDGSDNNER